MLGQARAGRIRVIGISGTQRSPSLPEAPSFSETTIAFGAAVGTQ